MNGTFRVGDWRARPQLHELESPEGQLVRVEPKSMEVLVALAEQPGEVRTREDLIDAVWGERFVTEEVLSHAIWDLRRAFGDNARQPTFIQTIPRTGYRLLAEVGHEAEARTQEIEAWSEPARPPADISPTPPAEAPRARRWAPLLLAVLLLAGTALLYWAVRPEAETLRVAVPEVLVEREAGPGTEPGTGPGDLAFVSTGIQVAALSTLGSLTRIAPLDSQQVGDAGPRPQEIALAAAADEVLLATVRLPADGGSTAEMTLRRYLGSDGRVLWTDSFEIPTDRAGARLLADTVRGRLLRAYPKRQAMGEVRGFDASDEDYLTYLELRTRLARGERFQEEDLVRLEALLRSSPRFVEGHLLAVKLAVQLYRDSRDASFLPRGLVLQSRAEAIAPDDPRPLEARFELELAGERFADAGATLEGLEERIPGDARVLLGRAQLLERQGELEAALPLRIRAATTHPSWTNLYLLALLEQRLGKVEEAREHLEELLRRAPGNRWGLSKLAEIELFFGDLARAEELYRQLLERSRQRNYLTNLGIARFLLGEHAAAVESYREALAMSPDHPVVLLNLAEAELAMGLESEAREGFASVLAMLEPAAEPGAPPRGPAEGGLSPIDSMMRALCLARLGRPQEAVAITQATARRSPEDSEVAYQAAMVYALVGDRNSALVNVERALGLGVQPRWFRVPGFNGLAGDPEFSALLATGDAQPMTG